MASRLTIPPEHRPKEHHVTVTDMDLARELCEAAHPFLNTTGAIVPCVQHRQEGARLLVLTKPEGAPVLAALLQHRAASEAPAEHNFGEWSEWSVGGVGAAATWTRTRACHCGHVAADVVDQDPAAVPADDAFHVGAPV